MSITLDGTNGITTPDLTVDTDTLVVDEANNRVGIGTSSPTAKLDVNGKVRLGANFNTDNDSATILDGGTFALAGSATGAYKTQFEIDSSTTYINANQYYDGGWQVYDSARAPAAIYLTCTNLNSYITFRTSTSNSGQTAERMRIDSSGNLLVGTTNTLDGSKIQSWNGIAARASDNYNSTPNIRFFTGVDTTGGIYCDFQNSGGARIGSISRSGASSVAYNTSSDYRLKEDWQPMTGASERVKALKPVNFAWKTDGSRVDGFLAHEAQAVVPEAVTGEKDAVDAEGKPVYQGIDQSKLVPLLTAALQEALVKIESLTARIEALEGAA